MRHLNYHHLLYFHTVAEEGSVAAAAKALHVTPQTISGQIKLLENVVGQPLFIKAGRGLKISDAGRAIKVYTDEIFSLGLTLAGQIRQEGVGVSAELRVGIADSIPKLVACQLMNAIASNEQRVKLVCTEGGLDVLLAELAVHHLDVIISDAHVPSGYTVRAYNHVLGKTPVAFYSPRKWAAKISRDFPAALNKVPMLLPTQTSPLRRRLNDWFDENGIEPDVVAEFDDSALMKTFGDAGHGVFPSPEIIGLDIRQRYQARMVGRVDKVYEEYVVISPQRRLRHDAIREIVEQGRLLFSG